MWLKLGSMILVGVWLTGCAGNDEPEEPVAKADEPAGVPDMPGAAGEGDGKEAGDSQADVGEEVQESGKMMDEPAAEGSMYIQPSHLNVRSGPGMEFDVARVITGGTAVEVMERKRVWARIGSGEWVSSTFLGPNPPSK